jgi:hypothetical protein
MKIVGALFGFAILAVVFVIWYRAYKDIKGDESALFSRGSRKPGTQNNSIEEFLAAYKRGDVTVGTSASPTATAAAAKPPPAPLAAPAAAQPDLAKRDPFVSGATKLAYLACKTGLRDHHIFAHVQLSMLSTGGAIDPALARAGVDLLICNSAMSVVAALDFIDAGNAPLNPAKADYLKALDIRYLRLSAKSLPRPDELHALLYKM